MSAKEVADENNNSFNRNKDKRMTGFEYSDAIIGFYITYVSPTGNRDAMDVKIDRAFSYSHALKQVRSIADGLRYVGCTDVNIYPVWSSIVPIVPSIQHRKEISLMSTVSETYVRFSSNNGKMAKLAKSPSLQPYLADGQKVYSFDLLAGHSCPFAQRCLAKVEIINGKPKVIDGPDQEQRCYAAMIETRPNVYNLHKANFDVLKSLDNIDAMASVIQSALPKNAGIVRIHSSGDFFSYTYFVAWLKVISHNPSVLFYAYTKCLPFWVQNIETIQRLPNLVLTASDGGTHDSMIVKHKLRQAIVTFSESEGGLEFDDDDSHAADPAKRDQSFLLLLHGSQPKGTPAGEALKAINRAKKALKVLEWS